MTNTMPRLAANTLPDQLLTLSAQGDRRAFAAFYDQTIRQTLGLIRGVLKDPAQSEEVAQEVYLEIWQNAARFDAEKSSAISVLFTLSRRRAIDRIRASQASRDRDLRMAKLTVKQREVIEVVHDEYLTQHEAALRLGIPLGTVKTRLRDSLIALRRELTTAA